MTRSDISGLPMAIIALICACLILAATPARAFPIGSSQRKLTICHDTTFALCAASTCTATGGFITDNQGIPHKAVSCTCPILTGDNIADLNGGNMQGSCTSSDPDVVFSTYEFSESFPQFVDGTWEPDQTAVIQVCPSQYSFSQCWNWKCTRIESQNGVELAQCTCPLEKTSYSFVTQAGQGDPSACADLPVGGPLFLDPGSTFSFSGH